MRALKALKNLAVKITPAESVNDVSGNTCSEVIEYIESNLSVPATGLVLTDTNDVVYDIGVSTAGELTATART